MNDLISRQAAIEAIAKLAKKHFDHPVIMCNVKTAIENLPSAEPISQIKWERDTAISQLKELGYGLGGKPKKGKWIDTHSEHYKCSCCGTRAAYWLNEENSYGREMGMSEWLSDFCPNCGARMEE